MNENCQRCIKGVLGLDGRVWCSLATCNYEQGKPMLYKPDKITVDKKIRRHLMGERI